MKIAIVVLIVVCICQIVIIGALADRAEDVYDLRRALWRTRHLSEMLYQVIAPSGDTLVMVSYEEVADIYRRYLPGALGKWANDGPGKGQSYSLSRGGIGKHFTREEIQWAEWEPVNAKSNK